MSNSTITLECRQLDDKTRSHANGDFEVSFDGIKVNSGDLISMRGIFIDTVRDAPDNINVKEDVDLTITVGYYLYDWTKDKIHQYFNMDADPLPSGESFYPVVDMRSGTVDKITFYVTNFQDEINDTKVDFAWKDNNNDDKTITFTLNTDGIKTPDNQVNHLWANGLDNEITLNPSITNVLNNSFHMTSANPIKAKITGEDQFVIFKYRGDNFTPTGAVQFGVLQNTQTFTFPKGSYTPDDFANTLTRILSENGSTPDPTYGDDSIFLTVTRDYGDANGELVHILADAKEVAYSNHKHLTTLDSSQTHGRDLWMGTNQIVFAFNDDSGKFEIQYMHMAIYDQGNIITGFFEQDDTDNTLKYKDMNSGVFFTKFDSKYKTISDKIDFIDIMGFSRDSLFCKLSGFTPNDGQLQQFMTTELIRGKNITSQYTGLDVMINHTSSSFYEPSSGVISATSDLTNVIEAPTQYRETESGQDQPYFLIEIDGLFKTDYHSQTYIKRNIKAIVSKYYAYNSFTIGDEGNDLVYQHVGDPIYLTSVHIRILNPDLTLSTNIGNDNTVFLDIKKLHPDVFHQLPLTTNLEKSRPSILSEK